MHLPVGVRTVELQQQQRQPERHLRQGFQVRVHSLRAAEARHGQGHSSGGSGAKDRGDHPDGRPVKAHGDGLPRQGEAPLHRGLAEVEDRAPEHRQRHQRRLLVERSGVHL